MEIWEDVFQSVAEKNQACLILNLYGRGWSDATFVPMKLVMTRGDNKSVRSQWAHPDRDQYKRYMKLFQQTCKEHSGYLRSLFSTIFYFDFQSAPKSIELIEKLNIPILIIWGDQDSLIPVENAYRYYRLYKNSSLKIISGANHSLLIEHSKETIEAIKTFLRDK